MANRAQRTVVLAANTEVGGMVWAAGTYTLRDDKWANMLVAAGGVEGVVAVKATLTTALVGANNDIKYTAKAAGVAGNDTAIEYVDPGTMNAALAIVVEGKTIEVRLATDAGAAITSTAALIRTALTASAAAMLLIDHALATGNDGTGVVTALAATLLAGGTDATGTAPPQQFNPMTGQWEYA